MDKKKDIYDDNELQNDIKEVVKEIKESDDDTAFNIAFDLWSKGYEQGNKAAMRKITSGTE